MLTGTIQVEDLISANWVHIRPRRTLALIDITLLALFFLAVILAFFGGRREPDWQDWLMLLLVPCVATIVAFVVPYKCRRAYEQRKDLQKECTLLPSDEGLSFKSADVEGMKAWSDYLKWKEGKSVFLLYVSDNLYQLVPKRFFATEADIENFRDTLTRRVKR